MTRTYSPAQAREAMRTGKLPRVRDDSGERQGWWEGETFIPDAPPPPVAEPASGACETEIQQSVVRELRRRGYFVFHVPNGGKRKTIEAAILVGMGVVAGVADLCVLLPAGRVLWLEVKAQSGTLSDAQKKFRETVNGLGHTYAVAWTLGMAVEAVAKYDQLTTKEA